MLDQPCSLHVLSQARGSSQFTGSTTSVLYAVGVVSKRCSASSTSSQLVGSGRRATSSSSVPRSWLRKMGEGACAANVDFPTPSTPYASTLSGATTLPFLMLSRVMRDAGFAATPFLIGVTVAFMVSGLLQAA